MTVKPICPTKPFHFVGQRFVVGVICLINDSGQATYEETSMSAPLASNASDLA